MVRFGLLGPLLLQPDGSQVEVTAAKHRTVLALLVARRNTAVGLGRVITELWPEHSPRSAVGNVRTYISCLRALLGPLRDRMTTLPGSYRLEVHDDELDAALFYARVTSARSALLAGDNSLALDRYAEALALWRGEAFQDVPPGPILSSYGGVLTDAGIAAWEDYHQAQFLTGDVGRAVAGLRRVLADHPIRESAWHKLINILYRCGDRAAALDAYQRARASLAEGLGIDPGPEMAALHTRILQGVPPVKPARLVPRQLPRPPALLVGRQAELRQIRRTLAGSHDSSPILGIHGIGGAGKSALAIAAAHAVADHYPDGQLYVNLQGCSPGVAPLEPAEVLGRFMRALGAAERRISPDTAETAAEFRTLTAGRRLLVVLDNADSTAQVRPLLPAGPGCGVLVTGRHSFDTLDGIDHLHLGVLSSAEAEELLASLAGQARVRADREAALQIVRLCGLLPLAVRVMGTRLARNPDAGLRRVADRLSRAQSRLDELGLGDLSVRSTFEAGYQTLAAGGMGAHARRLFWRLGRSQLAEITTGDAAALLDEDESTAWRALELLTAHGLIESTGAGFQLHDLLRLFAAELSERNESDADTDAAITRVAERYIGIIQRSKLLYLPGDGDPPHLDEVDEGAEEATPRDEAEAAQWIGRHLPILNALVRNLSGNRRTAALAWRVTHPLTRRLYIYHPAAAIELHGILVSCPHPPDLHDMARSWCVLSTSHMYLGRYRDARDCGQRAMNLLPFLDDTPLLARVLCIHGTALVRTGQPGLALRHILEATLLYQSLGRPKPVSICLNNAAQAAFFLDCYADNRALLQRSLAIARGLSDPHLTSAILDSLAAVHLRLGHPKATIWYASAAIRLCQAAPDVFVHSDSLQRRSMAWQIVGHSERAVADARAAVALCERASAADLRLDALRTLGVVLWLGADPEAAGVLREAELLAAAGGGSRV